MATNNPSQLFLLADHIKLSLLERQRAISLNLQPSDQDTQISRNLDQLRSGIQRLESQTPSWDDPLNAESEQQSHAENVARLTSLLTDLSAQFHPFPPADGPDPTASPSPSPPAATARKNVRFSDNDAPLTAANPPSRYMPYTDSPPLAPSPPPLTNTQLHAQHTSVMREQDDVLDSLSLSIGRQRDLSLAIGDELDEHALMLEEVDERVDRHGGQLGRARGRLEGVARRARRDWGCTVIVVLVVILVLLIVVTK